MIHTFTDPRGHTQTQIRTYTERLAENNCLGSNPACLHPPLSPGREHRSRGRHAGSDRSGVAGL